MNRFVWTRYVVPLGIPLTALVLGGIIVFAISRVLLSFSKETTPFVALSIALVVLLGASFVASRVSST
jgi:hypothetical protein